MSEVRVVRVADAPTTQMRIPDKGYSRHLVGPDHGARNVHEVISVLLVDAPLAPYHHHERAETIYHVLEGDVVVLVGDRRYRMGPDDIVFIPPGVPHAIGNPGAVEARALGIYAPSAHDDFHVVEMPDDIVDAVPGTSVAP